MRSVAGAFVSLAEPPPHLQAAAVGDGGGGRFLDRHEQVAQRRARPRQIDDADAAEQAELAEPALALGNRLDAERIALLKAQLAADDSGVGALVAGDQHVIHARLLAFAHQPDDRGSAIVVNRHGRGDGGRKVALVPVGPARARRDRR